MEVRIGVIYTSKEMEVDLGDEADRDKITAEIESAMADEKGMLWLTDRRGRRVGVPAAKVAYVEIGGDVGERRVGFSAV